jgi:hypothetical protein
LTFSRAAQLFTCSTSRAKGNLMQVMCPSNYHNFVGFLEFIGGQVLCSLKRSRVFVNWPCYPYTLNQPGETPDLTSVPPTDDEA